MASPAPRVSISQISHARRSFADDLRAYVGRGARRDRHLGAEARRGPDDAERSRRSAPPASRAPRRCRSCRRSCRCRCSAARRTPPSGSRRCSPRCTGWRRSRPPAIVCLTGPASAASPTRPAAIVVDGLRQLAAEAEWLGLRIAVEPYQRDGGERVDDRYDDPRGARADPRRGRLAGARLQFDVWHLWNTRDALRRHRDARRALRRRPRVRRAASRRAAGPTAPRPATGRLGAPHPAGARRGRLGRPLRHRDLLRRRDLRDAVRRLALAARADAAALHLRDAFERAWQARGVVEAQH